MFGMLLQAVNSGVIDSPTTGDNIADGVVNSNSGTLFIAVLISFVIGIVVGYGIRHIVQLFKDAPKDE